MNAQLVRSLPFQNGYIGAKTKDMKQSMKREGFYLHNEQLDEEKMGLEGKS